MIMQALNCLAEGETLPLRLDSQLCGFGPETAVDVRVDCFGEIVASSRPLIASPDPSVALFLETDGRIWIGRLLVSPMRAVTLTGEPRERTPHQVALPTAHIPCLGAAETV